ncbi:DUF4349 domain-containing protein [Spongiactinospora sp. TRM90649]|uniref:DUF4349 domain-containing protein n=1 Tax=Spongiactinospora sp. TRM90649 TaxID=3031114 RepID=UPI0023F7CCC1|nr:DUF4349 domain-containing protein [Spongiactinospora sp. TRM90649]MDF5757908.1 DUF4349 domain-containing protein [Spongiactinospora sp. TRM90649]
MSEFTHSLRLAAPILACLLLGTACGGGESSAPALGSQGAARDDAGGGNAAREPAPESKAKAQADTDEGKTGEPTDITPQERAVIYVSELTVRVKEVATAADKAKQIVTAAQGHLAREESDSFRPGDASARLEFKIPPPAYPAVLNRLQKELGTRESIRQGTQDVTQKVADVESRLKSAQSALDSLRTLLKRADTIGEVLQVEREISSREAGLESLQARQKSLAARTGMATVTLNLIGPAAPPTVQEDESAGFFGGLRAGWESLVDFTKVAVTVLGVLLPWMILIVPVVAGLFYLRGRRRRARQGRIREEAPAVPAEVGAAED